MNYITLPSELVGFINEKSEIVTTTTNQKMYMLHGHIENNDEEHQCPHCGSKLHVHDRRESTLRHLNFGPTLSCLKFVKTRYLCPSCRFTKMQDVPFQAEGHRISKQLFTFCKDLLAHGFTNKQTSFITGLGKNTVKEIDLQRLKDRYTIDGKRLIQPERKARFLGIDEFSLHKGHKYAVIIIDMETGHILWLAHGKKKASVYSFIDHVGQQWMDGVEAVACDMNSDFQEAIEDRCPHIQVVFDYFHIVKNFNDKVVSQVRKDEQRRLLAEGDIKGAQALKRSKYILTCSRETLMEKDNQAGQILCQGGEIFSKETVVAKSGYVQKYEELIKQNILLFTMDLIKEKLSEAYKMSDENLMAQAISEIMDICSATKNKHFLWFKRLLDNHFEGIIAHATYNISAGKIEGINNKIKTLRRQGYGYPDDEYFFLKLFDASRKTYVRNPIAQRAVS